MRFGYGPPLKLRYGVWTNRTRQPAGVMYTTLCVPHRVAIAAAGHSLLPEDLPSPHSIDTGTLLANRRSYVLYCARLSAYGVQREGRRRNAADERSGGSHMGQQDSNFVDNYADSLANGPGKQESQNDPPMPLPGTDTLKSHGSGDNSGTTDSGGEQSVNYKDLGQAAATHDFQQAHGNGWEYDPDAMLKQIKHLEDLRDNKMWKMKQSAEGVVDIY